MKKKDVGSSSDDDHSSDSSVTPQHVKEAATRLQTMANYQVDDWTVHQSDVYKELLLATTKRQYSLEQCTAWVLSVLIGIVNGCFGAAFNLCINQLNTWKYNSMRRYMSPGGDWRKPYLVNLAFAVCYSGFAGFLGSYFSPQAAGSGIPDIRAYLNGVHIPNFLTIRTLVAKTLGTSFAIASGLVVGKEGPFIHIGAILGAGISKMGSQSIARWTKGMLQPRLRQSLGSYFRQPVKTRDHVAAGSAAGVATAFGAPIGGILFAVEQGSSWFSTSMLWHAVVAAGTSLFVTSFLLGIHKRGSGLWGLKLSESLAFAFESQAGFLTHQYFYLPWELLVHMLMGVVAGVLGALLVKLNYFVSAYRKRWVQKTQPVRRMSEVVILAIITTTIWFFISYQSPCAPRPAASPLSFETTVPDGLSGQAILPSLWCEDKNDYSTWGALFYTPLGSAISRLYYAFWDPQQGDQLVFSNSALGLMFLLTYMALPFTYGLGSACGVFVPVVLCGAAGGRLVGNGVRALVLALGASPTQLTISLQSYAVIGSGALLGGVTRMLLSSVVLIMETSGAVDLVVPLIASTTVAKLVADALAIGLYDTTITQKAYPFLPAQPEGLTRIKQQHQLAVSDIMSPHPMCMPTVARIRDVVALLRQHRFGTIPLVEVSATAPIKLPPARPSADGKRTSWDKGVKQDASVNGKDTPHYAHVAENRDSNPTPQQRPSSPMDIPAANNASLYHPTASITLRRRSSIGGVAGTSPDSAVPRRVSADMVDVTKQHFGHAETAERVAAATRRVLARHNTMRNPPAAGAAPGSGSLGSNAPGSPKQAAGPGRALLHSQTMPVPQPDMPDAGVKPAALPGDAPPVDTINSEEHIVGVVTRRTLLKLLQLREGFQKDKAAKHRTQLMETLRKFEVNPWKPPSSAEGEEELFRSLSEADLDSYINLRPYMQRGPFTLPAHASLAQAYRLFRTMGLHHIIVTAGTAPVVGVITRSDLVPERADIVMHKKLEATLRAAVDDSDDEHDDDSTHGQNGLMTSLSARKLRLIEMLRGSPKKRKMKRGQTNSPRSSVSTAFASDVTTASQQQLHTTGSIDQGRARDSLEIPGPPAFPPAPQPPSTRAVQHQESFAFNVGRRQAGIANNDSSRFLFSVPDINTRVRSAPTSLGVEGGSPAAQTVASFPDVSPATLPDAQLTPMSANDPAAQVHSAPLEAPNDARTLHTTVVIQPRPAMLRRSKTIRRAKQLKELKNEIESQLTKGSAVQQLLSSTFHQPTTFIDGSGHEVAVNVDAQSGTLPSGSPAQQGCLGDSDNDMVPAWDIEGAPRVE